MNGVRILLRRDREELIERARVFADRIRSKYGDRVRRVYLIGSVARGQHDPRSDVDLVVVLSGKDSIPYHALKAEAVEALEAPVDLIVISEKELEAHEARGTRFYRELVGAVRIL